MPILLPVSDLHIENRVSPIRPDALHGVDFDVLIVAGDVIEGDATAGVRWTSEAANGRPSLFVPGNHDYHAPSGGPQDGMSVLDIDAAIRAACAAHGVVALLDGAATAAGLRFVGGTLWSDWKLASLWTEDVSLEQAAALARDAALRNPPSDFRRVRAPDGRPLDPYACMGLHAASRGLIGDALLASGPGAIAVTHHAPHPSAMDAYRNKPLPWWAPAFYASDLSTLIEAARPSLWIHGHVHARQEHLVGATRVFANPCPDMFVARTVLVDV